MSFSDAVNSATTLVLAVTVSEEEPTMFEVVRVDPEPMTRPELMVTGEAPTILDAVKVPVIQESPTTCRGFSGSVVPMPTFEVFEMTKVFWSPTLDVFWGAVMKK
jgi:hypothetical protein